VAILDTFFLLFEADTKPLEKGGKKAEQITDDIDDNLKATEKETKALGESFGSLAVKAAGAFASLMAVQKIAGSVLMAGEQAIELELMSNALGANAAEVSAWSGVVESATGDANSFAGSIESFNAKLQELELAGGVGDLLNVAYALGENIELMSGGKARKAMDLLPEIGAQLRELNSQQAYSLGEKLGLDQNTIFVLRKSEEELSGLLDRQRELNIADKEFTEISLDLRQALQAGGKVMTIMAQSLGKLLLPTINKVINSFVDFFLFLKDNERLVKSFFAVLAIGAGVLTAMYLPAIIAATGATLAYVASLLLIPALIGLALGAAVLLFEDLYTYLEGGESLIGSFIDYLKRIPQAFEDLVTRPLKEKWNDFKAFLGLGTNVDVNSAQGAIASASNNPLASQTSNSMSISRSNASKQSSVNINTIEVNTQATDAEAVNGAIVGTLENQIQQAQDQYQDGVDT